MYVCVCRAVTESQVHRCIAEGASTIEDVSQRCGAGTGCGSCVERIADLLGVPYDELWNRLARSA